MSEPYTEAIQQFNQLNPAGKDMVLSSMGIPSSNGGINIASLIACFLFSGVGFVAFMYGKKMGEPRPMLIGITLMIYPYLVSNTLWVYLIGFALTISLFIFKE